jgi:hypothetical protein
MPRVRLMSDLHLEFGPLDLEPAGEDVLALAGDVGIHTEGIAWADATARRLGVPVVMIAGNHEFYQNRQHRGHTIVSTIHDLHRAAADTNGWVTFLEREAGGGRRASASSARRSGPTSRSSAIRSPAQWAGGECG